jgi:hypothetical protein
LIEREAILSLSERLIAANKEIEEELDSFVKLDDSIVKTLEIRDEKLSPVVNSTHFNAARLNH